jgi:hypothetical protein
MTNLYNIGDYVFDIKRQKMVRIFADVVPFDTCPGENPPTYMCLWLKPEQNSELYYENELRPLTETEMVLARLTGKILC